MADPTTALLAAAAHVYGEVDNNISFDVWAPHEAARSVVQELGLLGDKQLQEPLLELLYDRCVACCCTTLCFTKPPSAAGAVHTCSS